MFERFTEPARRTIFFARYEASLLGARYIETEHLLLGLLREDQDLRRHLPSGKSDEIRKRIEENVPQPIERVSTSVDMPLSQDCRRVLIYAGEESDALRQRAIDCRHLTLGLLRLENTLAAALLRECGIGSETLRTAPSAPLSAAPPAAAKPASGPFPDVIARLSHLLSVADQLIELPGLRPLKRAPWTRKEALGHLIDWAAAHQQWLARALTAKELTAAGYPEDSWPAAQNYAEMSWMEARTLWVSLNRLLVHVMEAVPQDKADTPCRIGMAPPIPLRELVDRYVVHCEDIVGQLLMRG